VNRVPGAESATANLTGRAEPMLFVDFFVFLILRGTSELVFPFFWFEYLERTHKCFIDRHHSAGIIKFAAIVWRGENGY